MYCDFNFSTFIPIYSEDPLVWLGDATAAFLALIFKLGVQAEHWSAHFIVINHNISWHDGVTIGEKALGVVVQGTAAS